MLETETNIDPAVADDSVIRRDAPAPDAARSALVTEWQKKIEAGKKHFEDDFKRMRDNMQLAHAGADKDWIASNNYVVPLITRHINQAVAGLYAKNPTVVAKRKPRMDYTIWDGRQDSLQAAMESIANAAQPAVDPATGMPIPVAPPDPEALMLIQEVSQVQQKNIMLNRVCKTMQILLRHYLGEQSPNFKLQLKQLVRRTKICGVGYVFLGFQRLMEKSPDVVTQIEDISAQIAKIESLAADAADGLMEQDSARLEELRSMLVDLENQSEVIVREGPVFDFPRSTEIIIDPKCKHLSTLVGAEWFAREFHKTPEEIQEDYKVDIRGKFRTYRKDSGKNWTASDSKDKESFKDSCACVWEVWCKTTGQTFTLVDGYPDFVREPAAPQLRLERFWPLFVLTMNDVEHETELYPISDVHALRHTQMEYNRSRESRRLHRLSNQPMYVTVKGRLSEEDKGKLANRPPFAIVELNALAGGETVDALLQSFKSIPMDPSLYETNSEMEDIYRTVGAQEANIGGTSGATATESSIAEGSRMSANSSNVDDLDEMLSELIRSAAQLLLLELSVETARKIAGPGAQWPEMSREEIIDELMIDIQAGSSGRPNRAAELANMERGMPFLLQMDGVKSTPLAERYATLLDIDTEDLIADGLPSQVALNAMASKLIAGAKAPAGAPVDQTQQAAAGADNAPKPPETTPGAQPAYPVMQFDASGNRIA